MRDDLPSARVADEGHVRDGLQLQDDVLEVTGDTEQREAGRLAAGRGQRRVAEATATALRGDVRRAVADEVREDVARLVEHDRAVRHRQDQVLAVLARAVAALAGLAVGGAAVRLVVVVEQRGHGLVDDQHHVTAPAAVAAVRAAERLELLPVYGGTAVASATRGDVQLDAVHEGGHGMCLQLRTKILHSPVCHRAASMENTRKADPLPEREVRSASRKNRSGDRNDVHDLAATVGTELHRTGVKGEQRVVLATADAVARVEVGAALADQDLTGVDDLTAEALHAEPLSIGVATVPSGRCALLVCHLSSVPYFAAAGISVTLIAVYCWRWP